jgi:hypothetical protein
MDILFQDRPAIRGAAHRRDRGLGMFDKPRSQPRLGLLICAHGAGVLRQRVRVKDVLHLRRSARTCSAAVSPEIAATLPDRISSRRRVASAAHAPRTPSSSRGSKLSTSRSAIRARASAGSAKTSSVSFSTRTAIQEGYDGRPLLARRSLLCARRSRVRPPLTPAWRNMRGRS